MSRKLTIIGAPSSAGAYAPGQERAPEALRAAGLRGFFEQHGVRIREKNDLLGFRWRIDRENPRAMNVNQVAEVVQNVAAEVSDSLKKNEKILVIGGDCTI